MSSHEPVVDWRPFDYDDKKNTAPPVQELVWVVDEHQQQDEHEGVTLGVFDGFTMRLWNGTDDCSITHWAVLLPPEPPETALAWHYGPTATNPDPGRMWHTGCGKEVLSIDGGLICECGQQEGMKVPTAVPPAPEESRIAGIWVIPEINAVLVKHANGATVQIKCAEAGLVAEASEGEIHDWQQVWVPPSTKE